MKVWQGLHTSYLNTTFEADNPQDLQGLLQGGVINGAINELNFKDANDEVEKVLYAQMIPFAWSIAPTTARPFIL